MINIVDIQKENIMESKDTLIRTKADNIYISYPDPLKRFSLIKSPNLKKQVHVAPKCQNKTIRYPRYNTRYQKKLYINNIVTNKWTNFLY